jgi:hypothetical protein
MLLEPVVVSEEWYNHLHSVVYYGGNRNGSNLNLNIITLY